MSKDKAFDNAIKSMIREQLIARGITDDNVLDAFYHLPRHLFVPEDNINEAYEDHPIPIGNNQTLSQPYVIAYMLQSLNLSDNDKVLEIGTGSGYQTALLSKICKEVYTLDIFPTFIINAKKIHQLLNINNINYFAQDGIYGLNSYAPYDKIIVSCSMRTISNELLEQLSNKNGKMIVPIGNQFHQKLKLFEKVKNNIIIKDTINVLFVPMIDKLGSKY